uniref:FLYWCH-type domain-containing protein n=1 Tax=Ditylenchus dipsaci TaxID=166011 RepID=A0A915EI92_9BILA
MKATLTGREIVQTKTYWECDKVDECGCKARIHTITGTGVILKTVGVHSHNKSATEVSVRAIENTIKDSAVNTLERPAQIFNRVLIGVEEAVQAKLDKRMITAMAFVKPEDVMPVFAELEELLPEELDPILDWFQKYYIGMVCQQARKYDGPNVCSSALERL